MRKAKVPVSAEGHDISEHAIPSRADRKRITLIVSSVLDQNLELYGMISGKLKTEIVASALAEYLTNRGMNPFENRTERLRQVILSNANSTGLNSRASAASASKADR